MSRFVLLRELITVLALIGLASVAGLSAHHAREARAVARFASAGYERSLVHDRLMGTKLDLEALGADLEPKRLVFAWFIDLDRCNGCFDTIADWQYLEESDEHSLILFAAGNVVPSVEKRLRALRRTAIVRTEMARVSNILGFVLPNTKVMIDATGTVLLVDSRYSGQECGWSFEAQAAALRGMEAARPIRSIEPMRSGRGGE
jgi:hypothetical protein